MAQAALPPEAAEVAQQVGDVATGLAGALQELREIARGLHPALLAESGLRAALKALARRCAVPVRLDVQVEGRLPELAEIAAYYAVSEALTNTIKHAHASAADVEVAASNGLLHVCIRDDGRGGAALGPGSGLVGLKRRPAAASRCTARAARAPPCRSPCPSPTLAGPGRRPQPPARPITPAAAPPPIQGRSADTGEADGQTAPRPCMPKHGAVPA